MESRILYRILSGLTRIKYNRKIYYISCPNPKDRYLAEEIYHREIERSKKLGVLTQDQLKRNLMRMGLWTIENDEKLDTLHKNLVEFKTTLAKHQFQKQQIDTTKKMIAITKEEIIKIESVRYKFFQYTDVGQASLMKQRYVIYSSLLDNKLRRIFNGNFWSSPTFLIDKIIDEYGKVSPSQDDIRAVARNDTWRGYWMGRENIFALFGKPISELTEQQIALINWSAFYDKIYAHPERPANRIIEDDDMLDGWLILQNKKTEAENLQNIIYEKIYNNPRLAGAQEVFIPAKERADDPEAFVVDPDIIDSMNNAHAAAVKRQTIKHVKSKGIVNDGDLPANQMEIRRAAHEMALRGK